MTTNIFTSENSLIVASKVMYKPVVSQTCEV
jgi:hypothetical protein